MRSKITTFFLLFMLANYTHTSDFETYLNFGKQLQEEKKYEHALQQFEHALQHLSSDSASRLQLANYFLHLGLAIFYEAQPELVLRAFKNILHISKNIPSTYHYIGFTLATRLGKCKEAAIFYQHALSLNPESAETHFFLALAYLATGNLIRGFEEYEWRFKRPNKNNIRPDLDYPLEKQWAGQDVDRKRILLRAEQGLGDAFHFIRYAQLLKEMGATVIVETQKPLMTLLSLCDYIDEIIVIGQSLPEFDYQIALMSLAHIFRTTVPTIPRTIPYLYADPTLTTQWQKALNSDPNLKVGLCWQPDALNDACRLTISRREIPLQLMSRLKEVSGVSFYSLQKKEGLDQVKNLPLDFKLHLFDGNCDTHSIHEPLGENVSDFDQDHGAFMDTAAIIQNLDLVITIDSAIAHLASALGKPVWLLLPYVADWRWLEHRTDSPWYPAMRIFKQPKPFDWDGVVDQVFHELQTLTLQRQNKYHFEPA